MDNIWKEEEEKFLSAIKSVKIPDALLTNVPHLVLKNEKDLDNFPEGGGCYWIWTNEPITHFLHKNKTPEHFSGGEIIYNGIAKDKVKVRVKDHLFSTMDATWSGISLDLFLGDTTSHRKKASGNEGKVSYTRHYRTLKRKCKSGNKGDSIPDYKPLKLADDLLELNLSDKERDYIQENKDKIIHFRNGINITEPKHSSYEFRVYYIVGLSSLYLDFIEKKWREENGLPRLCSYSSGR